MPYRIKTEELLDLMIQDRLSGEDKLDLYRRINSDEDSEHALAWFYSVWDEFPTGKHDNKTRESFNILKEKLNFQNSFSSLNNLLINNTNSAFSIFKSTFRYAAVFLIAALSTWFLLKYTNIQAGSDKLQTNEIHIPLGSKGNITLNDGTQIWLNSGSHLVYTDFSKSEKREVFLQGEAFFDVQKDKNKPFIVNTSAIKVKVLGTKFNVKCYPTEKTVETILVSGKVEIEEINSLKRKKIVTLSPNQKATFINDNMEATLANDTLPITPIKSLKPLTSDRIEKVDPVVYTAWKDEKLIFENERFESLIIKLQRWYNVNIILKDNIIKNYRYTGTLQNETIEQALKALKLATPFDFIIDKNNVEIFVLKK